MVKAVCVGGGSTFTYVIKQKWPITSKCKYNIKFLVAAEEERTNRAENTSKIIVSLLKRTLEN